VESVGETLLSGGACLVGYADLRALAPDVRQGLDFGVSFAVALDPRIIAGIGSGPTREYYAEYVRANRLLDELGMAIASLLRSRGHRAEALAATNVGIDPATHSTQLPHKTVATRAGLGWIGKCALLVTEGFGPAIRLASVLTDAELPAAQAVDESQCGECVACVEACPGRAASGGEWRVGVAREAFFDAFACRETARQLAGRIGIDETLCGICIAACPWTRRYLEGSLVGD
jgi:epoxyqueuosine reductase